MTQTSMVSDDPKSVVALDQPIEVGSQPSVYGAYWQARSGFFAPPAKTPKSDPNVVRQSPT